MEVHTGLPEDCETTPEVELRKRGWGRVVVLTPKCRRAVHMETENQVFGN